MPTPEELLLNQYLLQAPTGAAGGFKAIMPQVLAAQNDAFRRSLEKPDTDAMQAAASRRAMQGQQDILAGLAMSTAIPQFHPLAQQSYRQGQAAQGASEMGEGTYTPGIGYVADPFKQRDRLTKALQAQAGAGAHFATAYGTQENQEAQRLHQERALAAQIKHQNQMAGIAGGQLALARQTAEMGKIQQVEDANGNKTFVRINMTPQGPQVLPLTVGGTTGATGQPRDLLPKQATTEERNTYATGGQVLQGASDLLRQLQDPLLRKEFGMIRGGLSEIQSATGLPVAQGDPAQQQARASVMARAYKIIHSLAGATLSQQEAGKILQFVPGPRDSAESIENKLRSAMEIAARDRATLRQSYGLPNVEPYGGGADWGSTSGGGTTAPGAPARPGDPYLRKTP